MIYATKIESPEIRLKKALNGMHCQGAEIQAVINFDMNKLTYAETWICKASFLPIFKARIFLMKVFYILVPDFLVQLFYIFIGTIFLMKKIKTKYILILNKLVLHLRTETF